MASSVPPWLLRVLPRALLLATVIAQLAMGDPYYGAFCLAALAVTLVPALLARRLDAGVPLGLELALLSLMLADMTLGNSLGLYARVPWYDKALHLGAAAWLGVLGFVGVYALHLAGRLRFHPWLDRLAILLVTVGVGAAWEIGEYAVDHVLGRATQGAPHATPLDDTLLDLALDALGGALGALAGGWYLGRSEDARARARAFARRLARRERRIDPRERGAPAPAPLTHARRA